MREPDKKNGPFLFDLATVTVLVTALVYFTGWTYAYHYFGYFKLGLLTLDIPSEYFFVYGFWVFQTWWWGIIPYGVGLLLLALIKPRISAPLTSVKTTWLLLLKQLQISAVVIAFILAWWLSSISANWYLQKQLHMGFPAYPLVRIWPKAPLPEDATLKELYEEFSGGVYRLLLESKDVLFLFKPRQDCKLARMPIVELPKNEIKLMRVLP